ncbi:RagB/SusD family nutrient uptake outer membrane protein [Paraflavitalea sp. CAU 1676]|uniref:RagB/SusD family nutrient uptake outer membrane protein n=1 Tax=Paraflavitalea sp. CAU 1676 TaxID=3032598 RepID=UPI0023DBAF7F|nr:RagB/SusD family nutrient uptake outer membrane protein [Paraflavitalea sp. CAU 1676]MDF2188187.1 RagB/SusD family nutrient uptake outer membrane protein [Paraflavitalea sp. CAU 1676]
MKKITNHTILTTILILSGAMLFMPACRKGLLDQSPTTEVLQNEFWLTESDATVALMGAYAATRPCFDRDYYFDGQGEFVRARGTSTTSGNLRLGDAYNGGNFGPSGYASSFDKMYRYLYGSVNRTNYVVNNINRMIESNVGNRATLEVLIGEAKLLRALTYFKLISMYGDVPYFTKTVSNVASEANKDMLSQTRLPIGQVKDSILLDIDYAVSKLPVKGAALGRLSKPAALSLRGKVNLYWGSWKKNGWPELEGFTQDISAANAAFTAAAADFKSVINDFGLTLYMGGDPGYLGQLGTADSLPNYYHLFTPKANGNPEMIFVFTHGGNATSQGEELMRDFAGRSHEGSQCWVSPRYEIADRYQTLTTGEFATKLVGMNPTTNGSARTAPNSAVNPQSYLNRDYRLKATLQWDYEVSVGMVSLQSTGMCPFIYQTWGANVTINGTPYITYNTDGVNSGYVFRKFVRNYSGQGRSDGDFAWPVIRLADVFLMYAEATNEVNGPQADAIEAVNKVRRRGKLPDLTPAMIADKTAFFNAIEQERIVELIGEGQRSFDIRRWRAIERIWGAPGTAGVWRRDTWGADRERYYQNASDRTYEQNYIFRIPPSERDLNPNLTQNTPWR